MRVLLAYPEFPTTYWGFQHSLALLGKRAMLPPLGLISVAALLPREWEVRLVDLNVEPLRGDDLGWADVAEEVVLPRLASALQQLGVRPGAPARRGVALPVFAASSAGPPRERRLASAG